MEKVTCLCGKNDYRVLYLLEDDKDNYQIVKCHNCDLVYMNPRPTGPNIEKFYKKNYYYDELAFDKDNFLKAKTLYRDIKKYLIKGSILDIGCSKGFFLNFMKEKNLSLHGIEPSTDSIRFAWNNFKIKIDKGYIDSAKIEKNSYDNVTAIDIIEHVTNPNITLKKIYQLLKKKGVAIIETPNIASFYHTIAKDRWMGFVLPFHLYYFTPKTLKRIFEKIGFKNIILETSHFNLISREGFFRSKGYGSFILIRNILRMFKRNPDQMSNKINKLIKDRLDKTSSKKFVPYDFSLLDRLENLLNRPLNYIFAKKLLSGDAIRIIAYK